MQAFPQNLDLFKGFKGAVHHQRDISFEELTQFGARPLRKRDEVERPKDKGGDETDDKGGACRLAARGNAVSLFSE